MGAMFSDIANIKYRAVLLIDIEESEGKQFSMIMSVSTPV